MSGKPSYLEKSESPRTHTNKEEVGTYIDDSWVRVDKELGMLPLNWLSERKLPKAKTISNITLCTR